MRIAVPCSLGLDGRVYQTTSGWPERPWRGGELAVTRMVGEFIPQLLKLCGVIEYTAKLSRRIQNGWDVAAEIGAIAWAGADPIDPIEDKVSHKREFASIHTFCIDSLRKKKVVTCRSCLE